MDNNKENGNTAVHGSGKDQQGTDKAPGEERGKGGQVTTEDLKGKKVDRDITDKEDEPLSADDER